MATAVKICGLRRAEDAEWAMECGADALGFVHEPSSPRCISASDLEWICRLDAFIPRVAVFGPFHPGYDLSAFHMVQALTCPGGWTGITLQAVRITPEQKSIDVNWGSVLVLDGFSNSAYGGTGELADWDAAAELVQSVKRPVILAGGLTPGNVQEAIGKVRPWAVDVSSGVEVRPGEKDPAKVKDFIQAVRSLD